MVSGLTDWLDGKLARLAGPEQPARRPARPRRRPALHRLHPDRPRSARRSSRSGSSSCWSAARSSSALMLLVLRHYGYPPLQVHYLGKAATLLLLYAFPVLLLADGRRRLAGSPSRSRGRSPSGARRCTCWPASSTSSRWPGSCVPSASGRAPVGAVTATPRGWRPAVDGRLPARRRPRRDPRPRLRPGRRGAGGARTGRARPSTGRRWRGRVLVALTMVIAGLLVAVTYDQAAAGARAGAGPRGPDRRHRPRVRRQRRAGRPAREAPPQGRPRTRDGAAGGHRRRPGALDDLAAAGAGPRPPCRSPGRACWSPSPTPTPRPTEDPVGARPRRTRRGQVRDGDLQLVVNALWAAGAEAVSINGQRLGPTTAIRFAGRGRARRLPPGHEPLRGERDRRPPHPLAAVPRQPARCRRPGAPSPCRSTCASTSRQEDQLTLPAASTSRAARSARPGARRPGRRPRRPRPTDPTPGG